MKRSALLLVAAAALALAPACGDDGPGDTGFADAGPRPDAGPDAAVSIDAAVADAMSDLPDAATVPDAPIDLSGPQVTVLSPDDPPAGNFDSAEIVTTNRVTVRCRVVANPNTGDPVDTSSVRVTLIGANGSSRDALAAPTTVQDEYEASISIAGFANGALTVRCTASDLAASPRTNSDEVNTFLDLGPTVLVFSPVAGSSISNAVDVVFRVSAAPVAAGDTTGSVVNASSLTMTIAGVDLSGDLTEDPVGSGVYKATINFEDARFNPSLDGAQTMTVSVANSRSATPVTRVSRTGFIADSDGPVIEFVDPLPGDFIAGIFTLTVKITDPATVDETSLVATIAGVHDFELSAIGSDEYAGSFDTRILPSTMVFPNIVVRARDLVGNQSSVGMVVTLDNQPPVAELDPPDMRDSFFKNQVGLLMCSNLYDPVGDDAPNDLESVPQLFELRARVEDLGNGATTGNNGILIPHAGVDDTRVQIYLLDDTSRALIVDTDGDGVCDDIDPTLVPTSVPMAANEAAVIDIDGIVPEGKANYVGATGFGGGPEASCNTDPDAQPPELICELTSPATRVPETMIGEDPVVFALPPFNDVQCMGNAADAVATNMSDGWVCVAVRAEDNLGNVGISKPLRICIDSDGDEAECSPWGTTSTANPPDCTGTYDAGTGTTNPAMDCTLPTEFADIPGLQVRRDDL